jgi:hypothetical protein
MSESKTTDSVNKDSEKIFIDKAPLKKDKDDNEVN